MSLRGRQSKESQERFRQTLLSKLRLKRAETSLGVHENARQGEEAFGFADRVRRAAYRFLLARAEAEGVELRCGWRNLPRPICCDLGAVRRAFLVLPHKEGQFLFDATQTQASGKDRIVLDIYERLGEMIVNGGDEE